ncbi:CD1871A family CXXC motif-containing protein [Oscillibacter sp.]|nr:CD1871A family CXXC motif-containing protein [Oscillibacter sp.]MDD3347988.1 CD1871A family CXXC motif-containing protein [Oscillibacter sp.]
MPRWTTAALLAAAVALIALGVLSGEAVDVMQKAVSICFECIGVG